MTDHPNTALNLTEKEDILESLVSELGRDGDSILTLIVGTQRDSHVNWKSLQLGLLILSVQLCSLICLVNVLWQALRIVVQRNVHYETFLKCIKVIIINLTSDYIIIFDLNYF